MSDRKSELDEQKRVPIPETLIWLYDGHGDDAEMEKLWSDFDDTWLNTTMCEPVVDERTKQIGGIMLTLDKTLANNEDVDDVDAEDDEERYNNHNNNLVLAYCIPPWFWSKPLWPFRIVDNHDDFKGKVRPTIRWTPTGLFCHVRHGNIVASDAIAIANTLPSTPTAAPTAGASESATATIVSTTAPSYDLLGTELPQLKESFQFYHGSDDIALQRTLFSTSLEVRCREDLFICVYHKFDLSTLTYKWDNTELQLLPTIENSTIDGTTQTTTTTKTTYRRNIAHCSTTRTITGMEIMDGKGRLLHTIPASSIPPWMWGTPLFPAYIDSERKIRPTTLSMIDRTRICETAPVK